MENNPHVIASDRPGITVNRLAIHPIDRNASKSNSNPLRMRMALRPPAYALDHLSGKSSTHPPGTFLNTRPNINIPMSGGNPNAAATRHRCAHTPKSTRRPDAAAPRRGARPVRRHHPPEREPQHRPERARHDTKRRSIVLTRRSLATRFSRSRSLSGVDPAPRRLVVLARTASAASPSTPLARWRASVPRPRRCDSSSTALRCARVADESPKSRRATLRLHQGWGKRLETRGTGRDGKSEGKGGETRGKRGRNRVSRRRYKPSRGEIAITGERMSPWYRERLGVVRRGDDLSSSSARRFSSSSARSRAAHFDRRCSCASATSFASVRRRWSDRRSSMFSFG